MDINRMSLADFEKMADQELNSQIEKTNTDYSNMIKNAVKYAKGAVLNTDEYDVEDEKENYIELALSNIRAAMAMLNEGDIKSELRSAEHHLMRGE